MIDFPGKLSCVVFTQGCNFICPYCHNPLLVPVSPKDTGHFYDEREILKFLDTRKGLLDGVAVTGGEPTLQKDLVPFCRTVRKMGFRLKLDSNGTRPDVLEKLFSEGLIDYMAMDIKTSLDNYSLVSKGRLDVRHIEKSIKLIMDSAPEYEFRTTCARPLIDAPVMHDIGRMIKGASRYILQKCSKNIEVLDPEFLKTESCFFSDSQMDELKSIADGYVASSSVR